MRTIKDYNDEDLECYQDKDLEKLRSVFKEATDLWRQRMTETKTPDGGSCVMGNGIGVPYLGPRKRRHEYEVVVFPPGQGTFCEKFTQEILDFLESKGIKGAEYVYGRMD